MDNCREHLVPIKKDSKVMGMIVLIWVMMLAVVFLCVTWVSKLGVFSFILSVAAIAGGVWLTRQLNVEYEYIFTNGEIDVDLITNKSARKRLITFKCKDIDRIEKYTKGLPMFEKQQYDKKSIYCNEKDSDTYCISFKHRLGKVCLVMQINENMQNVITPYLDKILAREAFK
ncbi:MAG: hypothetical protein E7568_03980 [Ruminococcaceae bacterium]|nr:hypothetical protein [Oscillospiraceae bacterium]